VRSKLRENDIYAQTIDLAMQKAPGVRDSRRWVGELRDELELLLKSDKAWQTTQIAAEVLQEVTVQHSIGEADLGKQLRVLLDAMSTEVAGTASYRTSPELCTRDGAPVLAGTPTAKAPMVVQPRSGCGCATGDSTGAGLLVVLLAAALRRRSRAASRTRSLRA
jgi:MYXO-CTERM domain-containing protein